MSTQAIAARIGANVATPPAEGPSVRTAIGGEMLVQLALTPVAAVTPALADALRVGEAQAAWLLTAYLLPLAGSLLVAGRLGDLLGHSRVFAAGSLVYAAAALASLGAPSFELVVAARVLQGFGAALASGNVLAIVARAVPEERRAQSFALVAATSSASGVAGSALGTLIVAAGYWQVLFLAMVPVALWAAWSALRLPIAERRVASVDWVGAALLLFTMTAAAVALSHPHGTASDEVMPFFHTWLPSVAVVGAAAFIWWERRTNTQLIQWRETRDRIFAGAIFVNGVLHLTMMSGMFLAPIITVRALGMDVVAGGMLMVIVQTITAASSLAGGTLYSRLRYPWIRPVAASLIAFGLLGWAASSYFGSYAGLVGAGVIAALGNGTLMATNNTVVMSRLSAASKGVASGMLETTRQFGHAFGVAIPTAMLALFGPGEMRAAATVACVVMAAVAFTGAAVAARSNAPLEARAA